MGEQSLIRSHHVQFNFHFHSDDVSISVDRTKTRTWQGQHFEFYISPSFWWSSWSPQWRPAVLDAYSFFLSFISDSLDFFSLSFPFFTFPWTNLHGSVSSSRCQFASRGPSTVLMNVLWGLILISQTRFLSHLKTEKNEEGKEEEKEDDGMNENCVIRWWPHRHKRRKWPPDRMGSDQFFNYELLKPSLNVVQVDSWVVGQWYWLKFERRAEQGKAELADALRKRLVVFISSFLLFSFFLFIVQVSMTTFSGAGSFTDAYAGQKYYPGLLRSSTLRTSRSRKPWLLLFILYNNSSPRFRKDERIGERTFRNSHIEFSSELSPRFQWLRLNCLSPTEGGQGKCC